MNTVLSLATTFALGCYAVASILVLLRLVRGPRAQDRRVCPRPAVLSARCSSCNVHQSRRIRHRTDAYFSGAILILLGL